MNKKRPFKQANDQQNQKMKNWLRGHLSNRNKESEILELFCGSGNFTQVISDLEYAKILAVEISNLSIDDLKSKNLSSVEAVSLNIYLPSSWSKIKKLIKPSILVLDPPREGFKDLKRFLDEVKTIKEIFYISCEISSWMHDMRTIQKLGYRVEEIIPIDQFPHTPHLELLTLITKT
jgi:23S rRNA (uracil1939-C5)-methyltransferase